MSNVKDLLISRLTDNYNKTPGSNVDKLMDIAAQHIQENEDLLTKINDWQDIDQAEGTTLDMLGRNVQQARGQASDDLYRVLIKSKIKRSLSDGSINTLIDFLSFLLNIDPSEIEIKELWQEGLNLQPLTFDYKNKVANSTIENPHFHRAFGGAAINVAPTLTGETTQAHYDNVEILDGIRNGDAITTVGNMVQQQYSFDLKAIEREYGSIPGSTTADKVTWLKNNLQKLTANIHLNGSNNLGYKASFVSWRADVSAWNTAVSHTNSAITKLTQIIDAALMQYRIDSNGYCHFLAYAEPCGLVANPTTAPTLSVSANGGSTLAPGTYYVRYSYQTPNLGETLLSSESSITVGSGQNLNVTVPTFPFGVTNAFIWITTTSGKATAFKINMNGLTTYTRNTAIGTEIAIQGTNTSNVPSSINTDYISLDVEFKPTADILTNANRKHATLHINVPGGAINSTGLSIGQFGTLINTIVASGVKAEVLFEGTFSFSSNYTTEETGNQDGFDGGTLGYTYDPTTDIDLPI